MFHASFLTILTCFIYTLHHLYAFSGTNLLTRCQRASCCFLLFLVSEILQRKYSRNWTKSTPRVLFFLGASRRPKRIRSGATRRPNHRVARPAWGSRRPMVWGPCQPSDSALPPTYTLRRENPITEIHDTEILPETQLPPIPSRGIQEITAGTLPEEEFIAGGICIAMPASEVMCE